ncbi:hypothetical protein ACFLZB_04615 [Nanoarchaeota archaeon]
MPDNLLEGGQKIANKTIETIDKILKPLNQIIEYVGIGCLGSFALRFVTQVYRRIVEKSELLKCKAKELSGEGTCPIPGVSPTDMTNYLHKCTYIKVDDKTPIPGTAPTECVGGYADLETDPRFKEHFSGSTSAWKLEGDLYTAYRWLCDRVFCHAAPAGWTQDEEITAIRAKSYDQRACALDASTVRKLETDDNCWETYGKDGQNILYSTVNKNEITNNKCYRLGNLLFAQKTKEETKTADGKTVDIYTLEEIGGGNKDRKQTLTTRLEGKYMFAQDTRNCKAVCGEGYDGKCESLSVLQAEYRVKFGPNWSPYPAGPTSDKGCSLALYPETQCYCWKDDVKSYEKEKASIESKGAKYAGMEEEENWPWSYRQWQVYRTSSGKAGVYYPEERYYSGRDQSAAFGMNHLLDYLFGEEKITEINPHTQHIGAFQSLCLTGIAKRLEMLKSIVQGFSNCLKQIETTGKADAGVCKELFTQYVCNLVYKVFEFFKDGEDCAGDVFTNSTKVEAPDIGKYLQIGSSSILDAVGDTTSELSDEYGNAKLNAFLEGGERALMKKVCLAAFGIDVGFDFNEFMDAAYSVPFKTSAAVFSSEGAVGKREFLSFNPTNVRSVYEYKAAWTIFPGCDLESYSIDLVAVTEVQAREIDNIDCDAVNNYEPGTNGCDNWGGSSELVKSFYSGGAVSQGIYVDQNKALNAEEPYRYDHFKITLNLDPQWDAERCFPKENRVGNKGVFYFPIHDATAKDLAQCEVTTDAKFVCSSFELNELGQAWIESTKCWNDAKTEWERCDSVPYSLEREDEVRVKTNIFTTGQKMCMKAHLTTQANEQYPQASVWWPIIGVGRPGTIPMEIPFTEVNNETFRGGHGTIKQLTSTSSYQECSFTIDDGSDIESHKKTTGRVNFNYKKVDSKYQLKIDPVSSVKLVSSTGYTIGSDGILKKGNQTAFDRSALESLQFTANGFGIKNIFGNVPLADKDITCSFQTTKPYSSTQNQQTWRILLELYYPDTDGQCSQASRRVMTPAGVAYETSQSINIKVSETKIETARESTYNRAFRQYKEGVAKNLASEFTDARDNFDQLIRDNQRDQIEVHSYWWMVMSLINLANQDSIVNTDQKNDYYTDALNLINAFLNNMLSDGYYKVKGQAVLTNDQYPADYELIAVYMEEIKLALIEELDNPFESVFDYSLDTTSTTCPECEQIDAAMKKLQDFLPLLTSKYYDTLTDEWVVKPYPRTAVQQAVVSTVTGSPTPSPTPSSTGGTTSTAKKTPIPASSRSSFWDYAPLVVEETVDETIDEAKVQATVAILEGKNLVVEGEKCVETAKSLWTCFSDVGKTLTDFDVATKIWDVAESLLTSEVISGVFKFMDTMERAEVERNVLALDGKDIIIDGAKWVEETASTWKYAGETLDNTEMTDKIMAALSSKLKVVAVNVATSDIATTIAEKVSVLSPSSDTKPATPSSTPPAAPAVCPVSDEIETDDFFAITDHLLCASEVIVGDEHWYKNQILPNEIVFLELADDYEAWYPEDITLYSPMSHFDMADYIMGQPDTVTVRVVK